MGIAGTKRTMFIHGMVWLSLVGVMLSIVAFAATWLGIVTEPVWLCLGLFPISLLGLALRFLVGRRSPATIPGITATDGLWIAVLLLGSVVVWTVSAPPGGWHAGNTLFTRIDLQGQVDMSPGQATMLKIQLTRVVSWGAFVLLMLGTMSWRNLALAETHWMPPETLQRNVKRRRIPSRIPK